MYTPLDCLKSLAVVVLALLLAACFEPQHGLVQHNADADLVIISGSENKMLEPIVQRFAHQEGAAIAMHYKGSVDIALELEMGSRMEADAVWPANSLWLTLGDTQKVVKHDASIMTSPVVFCLKRSRAQELGWADAAVSIQDILKAAEAGKLRFAMTSATQSNSGASAYFGFLHAMAGQPPVLTAEHLDDQEVQRQTARLLKQVNRSSGSSGWLKELLVERYDEFDAMVNYEAMLIEANQALVARGQEPMVGIYPVEGIMMADSPLAYIDKNDPAKEQLFLKLQEYLTSEQVQDEILGLGRRTGLVGVDKSKVDPAVFNPDWGIDLDRVIAPIRTPAEPVIRKALDLYQGGGLRKPSATVYVLDFSGSMQGEGEMQLKQAMALLLDPVQSRRVYLQPSAKDIHIVVPFDSQPRTVIEQRGNDPVVLQRLLGQIQGMQANGGTDIYAGAARGVLALASIPDLADYHAAVILMTDGKSQGDLRTLQAALISLQAERHITGPIPVFGIAFGNAEDRQLQDIAHATGARVFHGHGDLRKAFRKAKGYN